MTPDLIVARARETSTQHVAELLRDHDPQVVAKVLEGYLSGHAAALSVVIGHRLCAETVYRVADETVQIGQTSDEVAACHEAIMRAAIAGGRR